MLLDSALAPLISAADGRVFTGIIEEVGNVAGVEQRDARLRLAFSAAKVLAGLEVGDSIAVDGVCQTVTERTRDGFAVDTIATTLCRTTLGELRPGDPVNLERALAVGDRLGGHLVQGHVDAVATVRAVVPRAGDVLLDVAVPEEVAEVTVLHGSIAINGVSLTVNALPEPDVVQVALIPYTYEHTALSRLRAGDRANVEADLFGKFAVHYMRRRAAEGV